MLGQVNGSDLGIGAFLGGALLSEILSLSVSVQDVWGYLLIWIPLYAGMIFGGCGYVLPEFARLESGAVKSPSLWRRRKVMRLGFILFFGTSFVFATSYSVPTQVFNLRIVFPRIVAEMLNLIFLSGAFLVGVSAYFSARMPYYGWRPKPVRQWTLSRTLNLASWIMFSIGAILIQAFAIPAILLFGASGATYLTQRLVNKWSNSRSNADLPAPVTFVKGAVEFKTRLEIAKKTSDLIVQKYGKRILAVCMWGPSAKESGSEQFIDLVAVITSSEKYIPRLQFVYQGVAVSVAYWYESLLIERAEEFESEWPYWRYYFSTLRTLYERDNWTRHLKPAIEKSEKADANEAIRDEALNLIRRRMVLTDDLLSKDSREIKGSCSEIAETSGNLVMLVNRQYDVNQYWKDVFKCPIQPPDLVSMVDMAMGFVPVDEKSMVEVALKLCEEVLEMVRQRGIQLESTELQA